jgi:sporulation related protein
MKPDDYLEDGDERDRFSTGSIFASGWFRAVLVLGVLAITLVVTVPYLLRWMDPTPAKIERQVARPVEPRPVVAPVPIPVPAPVAPAVSAPPTPPTTTWSTVRTTPTATPPAPVTPAPVHPPAQAAASPAPRPTPPAVASTAITERMVPAPAQMAERDSKPAKPSLSEADSRAGEPAAKRTAQAESAPAKKAVPTETATARKAAPADGAPAKVAPAPAGRAGDFWVQVGAFQREDNAEALARSVREKTKMPARITSRSARADAPAVTSVRHEVFVSGAPVPAVNAALRGHGSAHPVRGGVAVQPPLELKEAVALSRRLSGEGMTVQIRRVGGAAATAAPAVAYVVRVGGFGTRAQAEAAKRELASKGVTGFVTPVSTAAAR